MNKNEKRYFHRDSGASTDQVLALLGTVLSDNKDDIDQLMNNSDT